EGVAKGVAVSNWSGRRRRAQVLAQDLLTGQCLGQDPQLVVAGARQFLVTVFGLPAYAREEGFLLLVGGQDDSAKCGAPAELIMASVGIRPAPAGIRTSRFALSR